MPKVTKKLFLRSCVENDVISSLWSKFCLKAARSKSASEWPYIYIRHWSPNRADNLKFFLIKHTSHVSQTLCKAWLTFVVVNRIFLRAKRKSDCQVSKVWSKNLKEMFSGDPKVWNVWNLADTRLVRDPHAGIVGVTSECENSEAVQKAHIWWKCFTQLEWSTQKANDRSSRWAHIWWKCDLQIPRLCFWHNKLEAAHNLTIIARLSHI